MTTDKRLLVSLAHPDDESFGPGAMIAKYVAEGAAVALIVSTKGDRGTIAQKYLDQYGSIEAVREAELNCACKVLGFDHVYKFGYRDSGMQGAPENDDPQSLIQAEREEITERIVKIIREFRPQVLLTFDPYGGYGHPDHIFMHHVTTAAFHAAGDGSQYPDAGTAYAPQKLYYYNIERFLIRIGIWSARLRLQNPRKLGVNKDIDLLEVLNHIPPAHARIDISAYMDVWQRASACHASQGGGRVGLGVPRVLRRFLFNRQTLSRAFPTVSTKTEVETDIFSDIQ